jgi:hypothetical protein
MDRNTKGENPRPDWDDLRMFPDDHRQPNPDAVASSWMFNVDVWLKMIGAKQIGDNGVM